MSPTPRPADNRKHPAPEASRLEVFIAAFSDFEEEAELFSRCKDTQSFYWWDVARYSVQHAIAREKKLFLNHIEQNPSNLLLRIRNFLQHLLNLVRLAVGLFRIKGHPVDALYISDRQLPEAQERITSENTLMLLFLKRAVATPPHFALRKSSVDFLLRILTPLFSVPKEVENDIVEISSALQHRFSSQVNFAPLMRFKYKESQAGLWVWKTILRRLPKLKRVLLLNDNKVHSLILLARKMGIETIEIQHGYMGKEHFGYRYPNLPFTLLTLPDKVWITIDTGDIIYPVAKEYLPRTRTPDATKKRDIDILIGANPGRFEELLQMLEMFVGKGISIAVKLHPVQRQEYNILRSKFSADEVAIYKGSDSFITLAERARIFIPVTSTSTTGFEAAKAGAEVILIYYDENKVTNIFDSVATASVDGFEALYAEVMKCLKRVKQ